MMKIRHRGRPVRRFDDRESASYVCGQERILDLGFSSLVHVLCRLARLEPGATDFAFLPSYGASSEATDALETWLLARLGGEFSELLWSSCGTTAMETALGLAFACARTEGRRTVLVAPGGYHGNSYLLGALTTRPGFARPVSRDIVTRFIDPFDNLCIEKIATILDQETPAALVLEPCIVTGNRMVVGADVLENVIALCRERGVTTILDESACGCFRHGSLSACSLLKTPPDILVLGKGLTSGLYPLSVAVVGRSLASKVDLETFNCGYTYGVTPKAAAIATRVLAESERLSQPETALIAQRLAMWAEQTRAVRPDLRIEGRGAIYRVELEERDDGFQAKLRREGIYCYGGVTPREKSVFVIAPPLDLQQEALEAALSTVRQCLLQK